ncbi:MAG: Glu/Leu/Phe/Val family dehydrogenase [Planctomycetota bacterium]|jgi:leucine dehydrogenase
MSTFEQMTERSHEQVSFHRDPETGTRAIIAVHSTALGPAFGGARRWYYATEADALYDVLRLSEGMTYKAAAANIAMGGGKAVIMLPTRSHEPTEAEARAMGRFVESLGGKYVSAEDVGLTPQYVDWMAQETRWVTGGDHACPGGDPSPHTARGVVNGMQAALAFCSRPVDFGGVTVAIQGAGNVGSHVARIVSGQGARVLVSDIDPDKAARLADACGGEVVDAADILTTECDILSPCALGGVIDASVIRKLRCSIICGGANNILDDYDEDGVALQASGIAYVPDFIANAGGVIELAGTVLGLTEKQRQQRIADIEVTALEVLRSAETHPSTFAAAVALAKQRITDGVDTQVTAE